MRLVMSVDKSTRISEIFSVDVQHDFSYLRSLASVCKIFSHMRDDNIMFVYVYVCVLSSVCLLFVSFDSTTFGLLKLLCKFLSGDAEVV